MKRSQFPSEQIVFVLRQTESGTPVIEVCRKSVKHAREIIENWRKDYNTVRPHSALGGLAPQEFMALVTFSPKTVPSGIRENLVN